MTRIRVTEEMVDAAFPLLHGGMEFADQGFLRDLLRAPVKQALQAALDTLEGPEPPDCPDHRERQHRDGKPPWCRACGWTHGRPARPAQQIRSET